MIGKSIRLERIMNRNTGKTVIVPMDHGVTVGAIDGLYNMRQTVSKVVAGGANAVLLHKGIPRYCHRGEGGDVGLIIHLSAGTSLSPDPNVKELICTVEEAIKIGADTVSIHINLGADTDNEMLRQLGYVGRKCDEWQIPLLAMMYTRGRAIKDECDAKNVAHAARVAAELGADIVKVSYTGSPESFAKVTQSCPTPVVIAGGSKMDSDREIFEVVKGALAAGAAGLSIGRNAFGHEKPVQMIRALCKVVHENISVDEALALLQE